MTNNARELIWKTKLKEASHMFPGANVPPRSLLASCYTGNVTLAIIQKSDVVGTLLSRQLKLIIIPMVILIGMRNSLYFSQLTGKQDQHASVSQVPFA